MVRDGSDRFATRAVEEGTGGNARVCPEVADTSGDSVENHAPRLVGRGFSAATSADRRTLGAALGADSQQQRSCFVDRRNTTIDFLSREIRVRTNEFGVDWQT